MYSSLTQIELRLAHLHCNLTALTHLSVLFPHRAY